MTVRRRPPPSPLPPARRPAGDHPVPPVRRHRIGDQLPSVIHPGPDPAAINLCRDLAVQTDAQAVVLFGSRATGGWDRAVRSRPDHRPSRSAGDEDDRRKVAIGRVLHRAQGATLPGLLASTTALHHGVSGWTAGGQDTGGVLRRRAPHPEPRHRPSRYQGRPHLHQEIPGTRTASATTATSSNEWELATLERLKRAVHGSFGNIELFMRDNFARWYAEGDPPARRHRLQCLHTDQGRERPRAAVELGSGAPVHPGRHLSPGLGGGDSRRHHPARRRLDSRCLPERPGTHRPVLRLWVRGGGNRSHRRCGSHVERSRKSTDIALWERIRALSGYDLAQAQSSSDSQT